MPWPTSTDVNNLLSSAGVTLGTGADVAGAASAASRLMERITNRTYQQVNAIRYFDGNGTEWLEVDPFISVITVASVDVSQNVLTTYPANTYQAYPANGPQKPTAAPYYRLRKVMSTLVFYNAAGDYWPRGSQNIQINAQWADFSDVPADIFQAATKIAALNLMGAAVFNQTGGIVTWSEEGIASETYGLHRDLFKEWQGDVDAVTSIYTRWTMG